MDLMTAMRERHSVRAYLDRPIEADKREKLSAFIEECNAESGLNMQIIFDDAAAFDCRMAHYGRFSGVCNYVALVGKKGGDTAEKCGYYGEKFVLYAQTLGLNTCWVALTYSRKKCACTVREGEKLFIVIALGYGASQGVRHRSVPLERTIVSDVTPPDWFMAGAEAALLAPTAVNQQKYKLVLADGKVTIRRGVGFYTDIDAGIVRYHFELGAGRENFAFGDE